MTKIAAVIHSLFASIRSVVSNVILRFWREGEFERFKKLLMVGYILPINLPRNPNVDVLTET